MLTTMQHTEGTSVASNDQLLVVDDGTPIVRQRQLKQP